MPELEIPKHLQDSIDWYDYAASRNRLGYLGIKFFQLVVTAAIPVVGLTTSDGLNGKQGLINAVLAGLLLVAEGIQQTMQFQAHWTEYRVASNSFRREKALFESRAGDYESAQDPVKLFCERAIMVMSQEHTAWVALQDNTKQKGGK